MPSGVASRTSPIILAITTREAIGAFGLGPAYVIPQGFRTFPGRPPCPRRWRRSWSLVLGAPAEAVLGQGPCKEGPRISGLLGPKCQTPAFCRATRRTLGSDCTHTSRSSSDEHMSKTYSTLQCRLLLQMPGIRAAQALFACCCVTSQAIVDSILEILSKS